MDLFGIMASVDCLAFLLNKSHTMLPILGSLRPPPLIPPKRGEEDERHGAVPAVHWVEFLLRNPTCLAV